MTPPENIESCSSIAAGTASTGMSKTTGMVTVLPGLISSPERDILTTRVDREYLSETNAGAGNAFGFARETRRRDPQGRRSHV